VPVSGSGHLRIVGIGPAVVEGGDVFRPPGLVDRSETPLMLSVSHRLPAGFPGPDEDDSHVPDSVEPCRARKNREGRLIDEELRAAIAGIPLLVGCAGPVERLGGLTNRVYRLGAHCVRIPGKGTEEYIDRANAAVAAREAARAGVSPEVVHFDDGAGVMVTRFIEGCETMSPDGFRRRTGSAARAGEALRALHESGAVFPFRFELFAMIDSYLRLLGDKKVAFPAGYHDVLGETGIVRAALAANPAPLAPCHCDPLCENFLDTGQRMWIVDWEYSGMNDPMWDLGDLAVEGQFDAALETEMACAYFGREATAAEIGRITVYKAMCDLLWTLWGLIQLANGNPADDFEAYANTRFARCLALMAAPDFAGHVEAVRSANRSPPLTQ
jgi:thiamine kinase-like enzyme